MCARPRLRCQCQFLSSPLLRLRGLCRGTNIDSHYTIKSIGTEVIFRGITNSDLKFSTAGSTPAWALKVLNEKGTSGRTLASAISYSLGKGTWVIGDDSVECGAGKEYQVQLKMTGCQEGEFTCDSGDCVKIEERCDQLPDCSDMSDERGCQLVILQEGYNKEVPPIVKLSPTNNTIMPVHVNVSINLLKVVTIHEAEHDIELQFSITMEWRDSRLTYHNIKKDQSQNSLRDEDLRRLWLPLLVYANTDQKETTRLGWVTEWRTSVVILRQGGATC